MQLPSKPKSGFFGQHRVASLKHAFSTREQQRNIYFQQSKKTAAQLGKKGYEEIIFHDNHDDDRDIEVLICKFPQNFVLNSLVNNVDCVDHLPLFLESIHFKILLWEYVAHL